MWKEKPGVGDHRTNDQREDLIREIGFQAGLGMGAERRYQDPSVAARVGRYSQE